jgi:DNA-binding NarL/FixJ family response regulator
MRVVLADEQPMMREDLRSILERADDLIVVAEAGNGPETMLAMQASRPDALVIRASLPDARLIELIPRLRAMLPGLCVLITVLEEEAEKAPALLAAGAQACIASKAPPAEFLQALRAVAQGGLYISGGLARLLLSARPTAPKDDLYHLTERETEVLRFIGGGFSNKEIARRLALSVRTVETHRLNIRRKTGSAHLCDLVHAARRLGLDRPEGFTGEPRAARFRTMQHLQLV